MSYSVAEAVALPSETLQGLPLERDGRFRRVVGDVSIRAYPFPYRAAFSVSNDCDSMSMQSYRDWHGFVNGSGETEYGVGLGLEIGDSFWVYSGGNKVVPSIYRAAAYDPAREIAKDLGEFLDLARMGWFDTLHSLGNWYPENSRPHWSLHRDQASAALETLGSLGLHPSVYTNHSGSQANIGSLWGYYQKADLPGHSFYCLDLFREFGIRYFWVDNFNNWLKFGDHLAFESEELLAAALRRFDWASWMRRRVPDEALEMLAAVAGKAAVRPDVLASIDLPDRREDLIKLLVGFFNRTLSAVPAQDGTPVYIFKRHRGFDQPVESTFAMQVSSRDLDQLLRRGGVTIVYQHFGIQGPRGRAPQLSRTARRSSNVPALDRHSVACWRDLAERRNAGDLFITTTSRLLHWLWLREAIAISVEKLAHRWVVRISGAECEVFGRTALRVADLNGFAVLVPEHAPAVEVILDGTVAALPVRRAPDPQHARLHAVYLPWTSLEWPL
jgi:hypothetical protein